MSTAYVGGVRPKFLDTQWPPDAPADRAPAAREGHAVRRDVQGLRALAVISVIVDHLFDWPPGGFVGVDVFFVISGFVITAMLLREQVQYGRISFVDFYRRRVRRIVPVATLVLGVTAIAANLVYLPTWARSIEVDAAWAALFGANWHLATVGTDYWADDGLVSPLQHYWSLSVEEQFYFVWPALIAAAFLFAGLMRLQGRKPTVVVGGVMTVLIAASFVWAMWETSANPTGAYFSTFSRAWELGLGALIAICAPLLARIPSTWRPIVAWVGLAGIVASIFVVDEAREFPAPWALLPVLATGLVIAAGTGGSQRALSPLTNPVSQWLGNLSFSLYLWHFPAIILLATVIPEGVSYYAVVVATVFGLSALSYYLLENPIRRSSWLEPSDGDYLTSSSHRRQQLVNVVGVGVVVAVIAAVSVAAWLPSLSSASATAPRLSTAAPSAIASVPAAGPSGATSPGENVPTTAAGALTTQISVALAATQFPEFQPNLDSLGVKNWVKEVTADGCADISSENAAACVTGAGDLDIAVIGDSYAIAWLPAIREALQPLGWKVHPYTRGQCPAAHVTVTRDGGSPFPECDGHRTWAIGAIKALRPDLVIVADSDNTLDRLASGTKDAAAAAEYQPGLTQTVAELRGAAPRLVLLTPPPKGGNLLNCVTRTSSPNDCESAVNDRAKSYLVTARTAVGTNAELIDTTGWFCVNGLCPGFVGTLPVRADGSHLTVAYSAAIAPVLRDALLPA
jgi:peptidoglycan/LPS O-acetylase OafA/YrhL